MYKYMVDAFVPKNKGCGADMGWDAARCEAFADFLNGHAQLGWRLHSSEFRQVTTNTGCGVQTGSWLVCTFERSV